MKNAASARKTVRDNERSANQHGSAGPEGVATAPPAYGIEIIDNESVAPVPDHAQGGQSLESATWSGGAVIQRKPVESGVGNHAFGKRRENKTGLPDRLKTGIEHLSGYSMDDVRVHYNSDKPVQLQALAYAQSTDIHIAPGQEKHLPHEAWHVVQQAQGRVKPTMQLRGKVKVNDHEGLEKEADIMGMRALKRVTLPKDGNCGDRANRNRLQTITKRDTVLQPKWVERDPDDRVRRWEQDEKYPDRTPGWYIRGKSRTDTWEEPLGPLGFTKDWNGTIPVQQERRGAVTSQTLVADTHRGSREEEEPVTLASSILSDPESKRTKSALGTEWAQKGLQTTDYANDARGVIADSTLFFSGGESTTMMAVGATGISGPYAPATALAIGTVLSLVNPIISQKSLNKTKAHIATLESILQGLSYGDLKEAVEYVIYKKKTKSGKKSVGRVPVFGGIVAFGKHRYQQAKKEGDESEQKKYYASVIQHAAIHGPESDKAVAVIVNLLNGEEAQISKVLNGDLTPLLKKMKTN